MCYLLNCSVLLGPLHELTYVVNHYYSDYFVYILNIGKTDVPA